ARQWARSSCTRSRHRAAPHAGIRMAAGGVGAGGRLHSPHGGGGSTRRQFIVNLLHRFSPARFLAVVVKEFIPMRRDRLTFAMMIGIPLMQLTLFGLVINSDPKHLPTALLMADHGPHAQTLLHAIRNTDYFDFVQQVRTEAEANELLARGKVQFVLS